MTDLQRIGDTLATARTTAPSEVAVAPDGTTGIIQWQGTPTTQKWLTAWVHKLMAAKLAEPYADSTEPEARATNAARLDAWHRALAGLPMEGLEAARVHFERHGIPDGRWGYLRPSDVSQWVRARARRRIPDGQECPEHPDQWGHSCQPCKDARRASVTPDLIRRIREQAKETR